MSDEYTKAIETSKTKLYIAMRFLGLALGSLTLEENDKLSSCATDGFKFYYNKDYIEISKGIALNRAYLHSVLHCLYRHIIMRSSRDKFLWDISCDIATEHIIDSMFKDINHTKEQQFMPCFVRKNHLLQLNLFIQF